MEQEVVIETFRQLNRTLHLEYLATLSPQRVYDLLSGLRGEDCEEELLYKYTVVGRLRSIVYEYRSGNAYEDRILDARELKSFKQYMTDLRRKGVNSGRRHHLNHLADAVFATQDHAIWGGHAMDLYGILRGIE